MKRKSWIILAVVIIVFSLGMYAIPKVFKYSDKNNNFNTEVSQRREKGSTQNILNINALILKPENLNETIRTTGTLLPDEEVDLSFETSGKITQLYFAEGLEVQKGTLLGKVNDLPLQAELQKFKAQIPLAEDRVFRQKSLLEKDAVSKEAYDQVTTELDKLRADIELVKARIAQTELRAPFDGVIGLRLVSEGAYATSSTVVSKLTKMRPLKLEFSINERHINDVKEGKRISFEIEGDLTKYIAAIYAVESKVDIKTRTLKARARYANDKGYLKPGRSAFIEIQLHQFENALMIPAEATIAEMGRTIVYLYKNGKAKQHSIERGIRTAANIQIIEGINVGDTLITTGVMQLRDGMPVRIEQLINGGV